VREGREAAAEGGGGLVGRVAAAAVQPALDLQSI
jgi:hypothetical protein